MLINLVLLFLHLMDIFDFELQKKIMQDEMIIVFCYVLCRDVVHGNTKLYRGCLYGHSGDYNTDIIGVLNWFLTYIILYVDQSCAFVSTRKRNGGIPDIYSIPRR
jgi:hypothetical protein